MTFFAKFILLLLFFPALMFAQRDSIYNKMPLENTSDSSFIVDKIVIAGNKRTQDFVILREMTIKNGTHLTSDLIEYDKSRIYSLGLFNRVDLRVQQMSENKVMLIVEVTERWYLFPYPILGIRDRDWKKWYYGAGVLHNNFRGRNEKLIGSIILGYDPSVALSYRNPFLSEMGTYFLDTRIAYNKVRNKSLLAQVNQENFDEQHFSFSLSLGKRFDLANTLWIYTGFEIVQINSIGLGRTRSQDGRDKFPIFSIGYSYDTRDLYEYPSYGTLVRGTITKFGLPSNDVDVIRYAANIHRFIPLFSEFVLASRVFTDIAAAGPTPSYNRTYFGYSERIRGHFTEIVEGESIFGVSAELHFPLLSEKYFKINFLPAEFGVWRIAVVAAAFADAGAVWFRNEPLALNNFLKGYGVGIHFLLPYSAVIRFEYALNEIRKGQFIIDAGSMFR
jgi:outer membrane protein assembly factor BamA